MATYSGKYNGTIALTAGLKRASNTTSYPLLSAELIQANDEGESLAEVLNKLFNTENPYATKQDITIAINNVINNAPDNLNTLKEISDWINEHKDNSTSIVESVTNFANDYYSKVEIDNKKFITEDYLKNQPLITVQDNVESDSSTDALSANQGRILNDTIQALKTQLEELLFKAPVLSSLRISGAQNVYEVGSVLSNPTLIWNFTNNSAGLQSLTATIGSQTKSITPPSVSTYIVEDTISSTTTFKIKGTYKKGSQFLNTNEVSTTVSFVLPLFWGVAEAQSTVDSNFIRSLTKVISANVNNTGDASPKVRITASSGQCNIETGKYLWVAVPKKYDKNVSLIMNTGIAIENGGFVRMDSVGESSDFNNLFPPTIKVTTGNTNEEDYVVFRTQNGGFGAIGFELYLK